MMTKKTNWNRNYNVMQVNMKKSQQRQPFRDEGMDDPDHVRGLNLSTNAKSCQSRDYDSIHMATTLRSDSIGNTLPLNIGRGRNNLTICKNPYTTGSLGLKYKTRNTNFILPNLALSPELPSRSQMRKTFAADGIAPCLPQNLNSYDNHYVME